MFLCECVELIRLLALFILELRCMVVGEPPTTALKSKICSPATTFEWCACALRYVSQML